VVAKFSEEEETVMNFVGDVLSTPQGECQSDTRLEKEEIRLFALQFEVASVSFPAFRTG
jgi:hypothetical protein